MVNLFRLRELIFENYHTSLQLCCNCYSYVAGSGTDIREFIKVRTNVTIGSHVEGLGRTSFYSQVHAYEGSVWKLLLQEEC